MAVLQITEELIIVTPGCEIGVFIVPEIYYDSDTQPVGFKEWTLQITYCGYTATLPKCSTCLNASTINIKMFLDFTGVFDYGSYTNTLLTFYETNG